MDRRTVLQGFGGMIGLSSPVGAGLLRAGDSAGAACPCPNAAEGSSAPAASIDPGAPDIRKLSQHFKEPNDNTAPWRFVPQENIKSLTTATHPGYVTIQDAGKGTDIKGILEKPIAMDDYPLPWEFHLGLTPAGYGCCGEVIWAVGLNLAVTFSDPSKWPTDRTQSPPDTHSLQVFVVHLKSPQLAPSDLNYQDPQHEVFLVYGRGDLAPEVVGNWKIPYIWQGQGTSVWDRSGGPASLTLGFRVKIISPTKLEIGFAGGLIGFPHPGWRMKSVDVSRIGKITGIWEIGPIISLDRWIPDVLAPELGLSSDPPVQPAEPGKDYLVDYGIFFGAGLKNLEHMSDDFDDPVPLAKWYHEAKAIIETYSHPGYLTATFLGTTTDAWGMCSTAIGEMIEPKDDFPGYEMEISYIPPEDNIPWNVYMSSIILYDEKGRKVGSENAPAGTEVRPDYNWHPGVMWVPREGQHRFSNNTPSLDTEGNRNDPVFVEFAPDVPESIFSHRPVFMLLQIIDSSHIRIGFKAHKLDPWYLSKTFDTTTRFGKIGKFLAHPCLTVSLSAGVEKGWGIGNYPRCPQVHLDYVHFRYGLSTER
jgi:hypothetical protein